MTTSQSRLRRGLAAVASVLLAAGLTVTVSTSARAATPTRVMPLGDSITDGCAGCTSAVPGAYRIDLEQFAKADGRAVDFVGSQSNGPAWLADHDHEGHPGWRIDEIRAQVDGWLDTYDPQVVLLLIGTNDMVQNHDVATAPDRLKDLVTRITDRKPGAQVFVGTLVPSSTQTYNDRISDYNRAVPGVVDSLANAGRKVHLVDLAAHVTTADLGPGDDVHPSYGGYAKMAHVWYSALLSFGVWRWEAEDYAVNDAQVITYGSAASGGRKVGHLDNDDSTLTWSGSACACRYRMYVRYDNGTGDTAVLQVSVNGGPESALSVPSLGGWENYGIVAVDVDLHDGAGNTVRFRHGTGYAEIDAIYFEIPGTTFV